MPYKSTDIVFFFFLVKLANTLAYTIFLVSQHHEVDQKLFEEVSSILTDEHASVDLNQLSAMTRLNMVIKVP